MSPEAAHLAGSFGRVALALVAGVATGALLAAGYIYSSLGEPVIIGGLLVVMLFYGTAIAVVCVPIWFILIRVDWDGPWSALALGSFATATFLVLTNPTSGELRMHLMTHTILPYALCGGAGALVTWWVGQKLKQK